MTGSVALDVVIGLAFMYLLYSLFATIIMEMISNWIGLRASNLKHSINRMLVDDEYSSKHRLLNNKIVASLWGIWLIITDKVGIDIESVKNRKKLFLDFYNQPSIKYLSHGGLFNKPSYLTAANFSKALLDSLKKDQVGTTPLSKIQNGISAIAGNEETKSHIQSLLEDANNDLEKFKVLIENWFDDTQERSIGWFKRYNQIWLLIIGLVMAVSFDASTLKMANKLATDKDAREQMVQLASSYLEKTPNVSDSSLLKMSDSVRLAFYKEQKKEIQAEIDQAQSVLGFGNTEFVWPWCKCFWTTLFTDFLGYFITALAISLGAPFWFDLLNKLVKLRSSVQQPARTAQGSTKNTGSNQEVLNREG
ncbi:MAG: hypothetical protein ABJF04_11290 [Reichenbachiella sp.]|uniref:hypothetical protein n=1 Tax=Reichenbachiella sp. TaxID=2184521 RepID=UPI0032644CE4